MAVLFWHGISSPKWWEQNFSAPSSSRSVRDQNWQSICPKWCACCKAGRLERSSQPQGWASTPHSKPPPLRDLGLVPGTAPLPSCQDDWWVCTAEWGETIPKRQAFHFAAFWHPRGPISLRTAHQSFSSWNQSHVLLFLPCCLSQSRFQRLSVPGQILSSLNMFFKKTAPTKGMCEQAPVTDSLWRNYFFSKFFSLWVS